MKINYIPYSMIVLLIGLVAVTAGQANAQVSQSNGQIELLSTSWGIGPEHTTRVSLVNFALADGSVRRFRARIQLIDTEGEVLAQSAEIEVAPGKTRFWDVPREQLPAGDSTGRIQMRARILVTTGSSDANCSRPPLPTIELINPSTGETTESRRIWYGGINGTWILLAEPPNS